MDRFVYADNAATTPVAPEVYDVMLPCLKDVYGNPSSIYSKGAEAAEILNDARECIADILGCKNKEIYFTASGSEADNWAIKGAAKAYSKKGKHIITTKFEHHAVINTMKSLEKEGFEVTYLDVDHDGQITADDVRTAIRPDTTLIAVMYANNEIGSILPIKEIAQVAREHKILCFTDAVQAVGSIPVNVRDLGVDMLAMSGHKINAPKGIGVLYIRSGVRIVNLIDGGGQENNKRGGTENVAYIAGLAKALELANERLSDTERIRRMRDRLIDGILKIPYTRLNGGIDNRLPGNANLTFEFVEGESLLLWLDINGICASTGSACSSNSLDPSHVLLAIGVPVEVAHGSLRFSLSHQNTNEDVDYILEKLPPIVDKLRAMSPLYEKIGGK